MMRDAPAATLRVPIASLEPQFDVDTPNYRGLNPATYLVLALCYDAMAAPSFRADASALVSAAVSPCYDVMTPRLAESFEASGPHDWLVHLRRGVRSHAGHELSAEDVKWAFEKVFALDTTGAYRWSQMAGLATSDDLQVVDGLTLRFKLRTPNPFLPSFLFCGVPLMVDAKEVGAHANAADPWGSEWLSARHVAGFGPYTFEGADGERMHFAARHDHWDDRELAPRVVVERVKTRAEGIAVLDTGDPAYVAGLRCDEVVPLRQRSDICLVGSWGSHTYIGMNYNRRPFNDVRVRRALALATPQREVIESGLLGMARAWRAPIPTYDPWYERDHWRYETNADRAKKLLAEAGYRDGFDTALFLPRRPDIERVAEILRTSYAKIGVNLDLRDARSVSAGSYPTFWIRAECGHNFNEPVYDLAHDYALIKPILPSPRARGGIDTWVGSYPGNQDMEEMYRDILLAPTADARRERAIAMQRALIDSVPIIPLAENLQVSAANTAAGEWIGDFDHRVVQALQFQNSGTGYLPGA